MNITGEGTSALSDLGFKKKDNKYVGEKALTDKESKEAKEQKEKFHVEQYLNKVPEGEKFLGFENVGTTMIKYLF